MSEYCGICGYYKYHCCTNSKSPYFNYYMIDVGSCKEYSLEIEDDE
jgi:hypothetical protein